MKIAIIGGGAAGFFLGANLLPSFSVYIFEKAASPLQKVKISGGGRCNVTHACFDPNLLVDFYPRGHKELKSVFGRFQPGDTMAWFEEKGIPLKIQEDMRVFPVSDNAMDIVTCLIKENQNKGTQIHLKEAVKNIHIKEKGFQLQTTQNSYHFDKIIFATGSSRQAWKLLKNLNHTIIEPVPSLFTFNCKDPRIEGLQGTTFQDAEIKILGENLENTGDLLITHWGFSGPAILVLSAWGARDLHARNYEFAVQINFVKQREKEAVETLLDLKNHHSSGKIGRFAPFDLTKRFWHTILKYVGISHTINWNEVSDKKIRQLAKELTQATFQVKGKSTFKDEFVTSGGVDLKEVNFRNMESKIIPGIYFAGEVLNIDAVTGGFNFQACWSESYIIAAHLNAML